MLCKEKSKCTGAITSHGRNVYGAPVFPGATGVVGEKHAEWVLDCWNQDPCLHTKLYPETIGYEYHVVHWHCWILMIHLTFKKLRVSFDNM